MYRLRVRVGSLDAAKHSDVALKEIRKIEREKIFSFDNKTISEQNENTKNETFSCSSTIEVAILKRETT